MPRKTSRRFTNYFKQNDQQEQEEQQQYPNERKQSQQQRQQSNEFQQPQQEHSGSSENKANDNDSLIADMAQGFIKAQALMNVDKTMSSNNQEIALLLQKVNDQLEEIKRSSQNFAQMSELNSKNSIGQDSSQQNAAGGTTQDNSSQQTDDGSSKKLQELLSSVLQGNNGDESSTTKSSNTQSNSNKKSNGGKNPQNMIAVQTVSQKLAQAQYELANELETSLKKLKQVISESEKLANNISNLLGEETMR